MVRVDMDPGLYRVASRLQAHLYNEQQVQKEKENLLIHGQKADASITYDPQTASQAQESMLNELLTEYVAKLSKKELKPNQVIAVSQSFGVATLLSVRQIFKSPLMIALYTVFVIAACYHAFNGLWSAMIAWGGNFNCQITSSYALDRHCIYNRAYSFRSCCYLVNIFSKS